MTDRLMVLAAALAVQASAPGAPARAFDPRRVRLLDGPLRQIQELHRAGLVGGLEPDRLLFPFRRCAGLPQPAGVTGGYGGWDDEFIAGHYGGHYLSAAARMYAATGDESFRDKAVHMVSALAECQDKLGGGYLAAFPASSFDRLEADPRQGSVQYYTIHKILAGLLDVHALCGDEQALAMAQRMADYFAGRLARLTPAQIEALFRTDYTANPHNEFGGMAEALTDLYELAQRHGDANAERHLKLAALFFRDWFVDPLVRGEDRLDGLHGNTHVAQASALARSALTTGDARHGQAAETFWRLVVNEHSFVNGGNGFNEKLRAAGCEVAGDGDSALSPRTAETCNTHNMLKLSSHLFRRDPRAAYADYMELALLNHIAASVAPDSGQVTYFTPLRPGDFRVYLDSPYCCQGTGIENAARFGEGIYFHRDDALWVNQYVASTLDWREQGLAIRLDTRYPEDGLIRLTVAAAQPRAATLHLRIPGWLPGPAEARVNGQTVANLPPAGSYLSLARIWSDGDAVELRLPLGLRQRASMDDPSVISFFHGPLLLAGQLGRADMPASDTGGHTAFADAPACPVPVIVTAPPDQATALLRPVEGAPATYTARLTQRADRRLVDVVLAPLHRVHHQRYAVYWTTVSPAELAAQAASQTTLAEGPGL